MSTERFNSLGIKEIDLSDWSEEMVCHWACWNKEDGEVVLRTEVRIVLHAPDGKSYTAVFDLKLEEQ